MVDIKGYEGKYAITSCGKVWSYKNKRFLSTHKNSKGYKRVYLCKDNIGKFLAIHRLVAKAYIPNIDNLPQVNHKDENKENNSVNNLEWCANKYNSNYGTRNKRMAKSKWKKVLCLELDRIFDSEKQAERELKIGVSRISECCSGRNKTAGGYHWRYADEFSKESEDENGKRTDR